MKLQKEVIFNVKDHKMLGGTCNRRKSQNALELLESVACDCVLVLMAVLALKCYSFHDSYIN